MSVGPDWLMWQLADSAFPAGGFAHSAGLESAVQQGEVRSVNDLHGFIEAGLCQFGHASLPFMTTAYRESVSSFETCSRRREEADFEAKSPAVLRLLTSAATRKAIFQTRSERLRELDCLCDSFTTNHVANRASRLQGQAFLASVRRIFDTSTERRLCMPDTTELPHGHLAPVFGVITAELALSLIDASRLFCFLYLRSVISAAVRLSVVGPLQAQTLQHRLSPYAEEILLRCQNLGIDEITQTAPLLDLWQARHDQLYSRLFQS